ncbi:MAG: hypothetical protein ABSF38_02330 [Verrucomicrobiota bacterium]
MKFVEKKVWTEISLEGGYHFITGLRTKFFEPGFVGKRNPFLRLSLERFKKKCSRGLMGNVFGEAPNTAGEGARAPPESRCLSGYSFHGIALAASGEREGGGVVARGQGGCRVAGHFKIDGLLSNPQRNMPTLILWNVGIFILTTP